MSEMQENLGDREILNAGFEQRLERLEQISSAMSSGEIELSKAADLFEIGISLTRSLEKELSSVEGRVERLIKDPGKDGEKPVLELFPELSSDQE